MAYYQSTANITRQIEHPHYESLEVLNYNQDFSNGTTGVTAGGDCSISVVDALYKGFEGNYWSSNQRANFNNFANSRANATNSSPFDYGTYNKGPISGRGGLSGGWGTMSGKILKIEKTSKISVMKLFFSSPKKEKKTEILIEPDLKDWIQKWLKD